jgi:dihydrofolate reductase
MRRAILKMHVSLDGYVRATNGDAMGWAFRTYDEAMREWEFALLRSAAVHLMGRVLYEEMAAHGPNAAGAFAGPMNEIPKAVFSRTLPRADWPVTEVVRDDVPEAIRRMKRESGGDLLVHGGARLARALASEDVLDEYRLVVHPVVLGGGLPLFVVPLELRLVDVHPFATGAVAITYRPLSGSS